ncbi:MAG: AAA family ATPase [Coriobacteriia bacterium]|nr:AAA family ATPase [Coriobacteriia bacterium]MCL2537140.1 AAA family ATPase [Coriobacteriia bacterium]
MKRKISDKLQAWKNSPHRKPLVLNGARQVGKTYSVKKFAQEFYDECVVIDFSAQADACQLFANNIKPDALLPLLRTYTKSKIEPEKTLLFFDEVQVCPRALTSLKYFYEQAPEYHIIAAGSLLGVALDRDKASYPVGKVDTLIQRPMDFEEYLWACGETSLAELIRQAFAANEPFALHEYALGYYRRFLMCGGMPEATKAATDDLSRGTDADLTRVREIQAHISEAYIADMTKYASAIDSAKILNVWRSIPEQLAKENHKFQYTTIASSARAHQYEAPINWLDAAGLINFCYRVSDGQAPLGAFEQRDYFKLYLLDVGLLTSLYQAQPSDIDPSGDKAARFRGGVSENFVMQQLLVGGISPHYWGTQSQSEVEFLFRDAAGSIIPIEVKSGKNVTSRSLTAFRSKYQPPFVIRISAKDFGLEHGIKSVPLYAAFCIDAQYSEPDRGQLTLV